MIKKLSHVNVFVADQDRAKAFYTEKLGFEVRSDTTMDGFRWLKVGPKDQPDLNILLARPQPPMFSEEDAQTLLRLVAKGVMASSGAQVIRIAAQVGAVKPAVHNLGRGRRLDVANRPQRVVGTRQGGESQLWCPTQTAESRRRAVA